MQLFVKTPADRTVPVHVTGEETVAALKAKADVEGTLVYAGVCLEDSELLSAYALQREATIQAVIPVVGGREKKKKKRTFTKPKKPVHRHKLEKMRALKYFKVTENDDGSYKVERTRKECHHPQCGSGVFMAQHKDREYCGKCHLTYKKEGK
ncbi:small subunit ribosomal protein S27Ae [Strigomonas culicis]|uniref:Ubiquitin-ribosomal protein eL40 fusion protein n=1 Tax=Strigomonas culicis TaxID=28005 RepID=S9U6T5_9TRYP|nr:small subunit ribosomal protein S27Ae [Strigomonas culicis]|eukprot:EPY24504.1 small subunit ribosomal protein S27Ae [Strigomonas culicis]